MKTAFTLIMITLATFVTNAQALYTKAFGNSKNTPVIFLHGGPGYNCAGFESTTAKKLADKGFYVIVYDRRGEGRSKDENAAFTFQQTFDDLNDIYKQYHLRKAILMGHSYGGVIATLFAEKYPDKTYSLFLVSAPVSLQESFKTIIKSSKAIYQSKNDTTSLKYIALLETMDTTKLEYGSYCFGNAMKNGFYTPKKMSEEAKATYADFKQDTALIKYASQMTRTAPLGFWKNEHYTTIDLTENLKNLMAKKIHIYGLYGKDDGLYSSDQVAGLQRLIGEQNVKYIDDCSHNVFMDQPTEFFKALTVWGHQ